jgi:hypothetical protein
MKLPAIKIPKIKLPDFSHLHHGSLVAGSIALAAAVLFIIIPDAQTAAHGISAGRDVQGLVSGLRELHKADASFVTVSDADFTRIEGSKVSGDAVTRTLQAGWLQHLEVRPATVEQPNDAFTLSFVEADPYACPRVVRAMARKAAHITVAKTDINASALADSAQLDTLCSGPDPTIEMTFGRE